MNMDRRVYKEFLACEISTQIEYLCIEKGFLILHFLITTQFFKLVWCPYLNQTLSLLGQALIPERRKLSKFWTRIQGWKIAQSSQLQ